ncbi:SDR family oxidoreductase [Gluconacetobacter sp. 1b LMG 1731]|uniref:SDR family oxidoreductase n=1 Tax=Gluconacetobacter dulcium TaxID=2729096 RepID=A0A7W4NTR4_9PROT|nr:SDR family oxidoreductase [Gluconacetobacter dulcium]MBB2163483.1 SDR family oxidoreductase [Gluconacetobacter dulcium]MBB2192400.1 SDR family oxidoreductase [Gluconacetobacter dulcium]
MPQESENSRRKTVVISGATGGIGRFLCRQLRQEGCRVVILSRQADMPADIAADMAVTCDLMDAGAIATAGVAIRRACPRIDLFISCAGTISPQTVGVLDSERVRRQVETNLTGVILLTQEVLPNIAVGGRILFVNSMAGVFPLAGSAVYTASKFGLRGFARALAQELRPRGIHVLSVFPGSVDTSMFRDEMEQGGSLLNFMSWPQAPERAAAWILAAARGRKEEHFPSIIDRIFPPLFLCSPMFLRLCMPVMTVWSRLTRWCYRRRRGRG